jgi:hypothetical protein
MSKKISFLFLHRYRGTVNFVKIDNFLLSIIIISLFYSPTQILILTVTHAKLFYIFVLILPFKRLFFFTLFLIFRYY